MKPENWLVRLVVYGLAVYRTTHLFVYEDGPFDIFDWLRARAGIGLTYHMESRYEVERKEHVADTFWGRLLLCPLCLSVWIGGIAAACLFIKNIILDGIATWLALSGISTILFNREAKNENIS